MKKNKIIAVLTICTLFLGLSSCEDDDVTGLNTNPKPTATAGETSFTVDEGDTIFVPFTIDNPTNKVAQFKIEVVGGTATQVEDYIAGDGTTRPEVGNVGDGFDFSVPAFADSFEIPVEIFFDFDQTEGAEIIMLKISAAGTRTVLTQDGGVNVSISIADFQFCPFVLDTVDTYGDSWNGASVRLTADGVVTDFANDGSTGTDTQTFEIAVPMGSDYSFEFVSGDWDGEIEYTLTGPDGTVWADAYYPAVGVITSGTCN